VSQSFNTPECRDDCGSAWHHQHLLDQESAERWMKDESETLGFRLASDSGKQTLRGGAWLFASAVAGEPTDRLVIASRSGAFIGFRLVEERA